MAQGKPGVDLEDTTDETQTGPPQNQRWPRRATLPDQSRAVLPLGREGERQRRRDYQLPAPSSQAFHLVSLSANHLSAASSGSMPSTSASLAMTAMSRFEKFIFWTIW